MTGNPPGTTREFAPLPDNAALFGGLADRYDRYAQALDRSTGPLYDWLDERLGRGGRALDAGCGTGRRTVFLADRFDEVHGADLAPAMIGIARRDRSRPNIRYQVRDILRMTPDTDGLFDAVLVFSCVLHIGHPSVTLPGLRRLTAPGGILLIVEPKRPPGWGGVGWQADLAFRSARAAFDAGGGLQDAVAALRLMLSPEWREVSELSVPLTPEEFRREYGAALPGAEVTEADDPVGFFAVSWRAPAGD